MWRVLLTCVVVSIASSSQVVARDVPAFPGAEGFGAVASGGRGGSVYYVRNLNDRGPGSLRDAVREGNRTVLFQVSGTINLGTTLNIEQANITIAGQTAPGGGICLRGKGLTIGGRNIIVRFLRVRPGDELGEEHDALTINSARDVIVDHLSLSWSVDSVNDVVRDNENITVEWCFITEPLDNSVHEKGAHGYGTGWGSGPQRGSSFHHNLLAHCNSRSPRIGSERGALVDVRNNVIYNMGSGWAYGGERARINYVANYYKPGPNTKRPAEIFRVSSPDTRMFLNGNFVEHQPAVTADNFSGLATDKNVDPTHAVVSEPFAATAVDTRSAEEAFALILQHGGALLPTRDAVDARIVRDVQNGTGRIIDSPADVGGWPELATIAPPADTDGDGMPDAWERSNGLDANNGADGPATNQTGYTNLERYLNDLAAPAMVATSGPKSK